MRQNRREYIEILESLDGDVPGRKAALDYVEDSDIWAHGAPVPFSYVPNLVGTDDVSFLRSVCETTHAILTKVIRRFLDDPAYRKLFHFPYRRNHRQCGAGRGCHCLSRYGCACRLWKNHHWQQNKFTGKRHLPCRNGLRYPCRRRCHHRA